MIWIIVGIILVLIITIIIGTFPMKVPREPDKEHAADEASIIAYDKVSRGPIFIFERYNTLRVLTKMQPQGLLIDAGCGPGYLAAEIARIFPSLQVIGLDINNQALNIAKRHWLPSNPNLAFLTADVQKLPFEDKSIDFVVTSLSLHHWVNARTGLHEIYRVLKNGGQLLIFDLRRDAWRFFYYGLIIGQLFAPKPLQHTNGAVGSFWASYTFSEAQSLISELAWRKVNIRKWFGWMLISALK